MEKEEVIVENKKEAKKKVKKKPDIGQAFVKVTAILMAIMMVITGCISILYYVFH